LSPEANRNVERATIENDPEATIQASAGAFGTVSTLETLAGKTSTALALIRATERKHSALAPEVLSTLNEMLDLVASANAGVDDASAKLLAERMRSLLPSLQTARGSSPYELQGLLLACERVIQNFIVRSKAVPDLVITPPAALRISLDRPTESAVINTRLAVRISNPGRDPFEQAQITFMTATPSALITSGTVEIESLAPGERRIVECELQVDSGLDDEIELRIHANYVVANVQHSVHASGRVPVMPLVGSIPYALRYMTLAPVEPERTDLFHGRERELAELTSVFAGGRLRRLYFVNGIRRVGKSTLMKNLGVRCGTEVLALVFSLETLLEGQMLTTIQLVRQLIRSALEQLRREKVTLAQQLAVPGAGAFELDPPWTVLDDFLEQLRSATGKSNILICFDEVQRLVERIADPSDPIDDGFLSWLRGKIQSGSDLLVACTGSEPFATMRGRYQHTLWGNMEPYNISFVNREAMVRIATVPVAQDKVTWLPESLEELWDMTEGHPWIIQILAEKATEALNIEHRRIVTPGDVTRAADRVAASSHVSDLWWNESDGCVTTTHRQIAFLILQHQQQPGAGLPEMRLAELCQWSGIRSAGKFFDEMRTLEVLTELKSDGEPRWRIKGRFLERHLEVLRQRALQEVGAGIDAEPAQRSLALMLDWENVKIGLLDILRGLPEGKAKELQKTLDVNDLAIRLLSAAAKHGASRQRWAVADWDKTTFKGDQKAFKNARYWTDIAGVDKANASDHVLLEKIHFVLRQHPEIGVFIIGTGDGDFHEAIKTLQEQGKHVILWSTRSSLNRAYGESLRGPDQIQIEWLEDLVFGEAAGDETVG